MSQMDYKALAEGVDQMREAVKAMVAGLISDGFTDRDARQIVAGIFVSRGKEDE